MLGPLYFQATMFSASVEVCSSSASNSAAMAKGDNSPTRAAAAATKKKRNLPGNPDPNAEVIALSPKTLMATNRFSCEVCGKGFQRDQNLQLHRRGHNLPWKLKQREGQEIRKKVYVCPEVSCVHHEPSRALGDLTGIKKHFSRKHGEKKWRCEKCLRKYAVQSDWKAHQKVCGTREYCCDCGAVFSRRDSFVTHRAFCDALAVENANATCQKQQDNSHQRFHGPDKGNTPCPPAEGVSNAMDAPPSPISHPSSQPSSSDFAHGPMAKPNFRPNRSSTSANDIPQQDVIGNIPYGCSSQGPALSLSLGTEPESGPTDPPSEIVTCSTETYSTVAYRERSKTRDPALGKEDKDKWSLFSEAAGALTSSVTADSEQCADYVEQHSNVGLSMSSGCLAQNSYSSIFDSPLPSHSCVLTPNYLGKPLLQHQHHKGSGQMPATALLQKAVMMGATTNNPYLLRNYGVRGDMSSLLSGGTLKERWVGSTFSSSWHGSTAAAAASSAGEVYNSDYSHEHGAYGGAPLRPFFHDRQWTLEHTESSSSDQTSAQVESVSCSASISSMNPRNFREACDSTNLSSSTTLMEFEGRADDEDERTTLDFLGVGSCTAGKAKDGLLHLDLNVSHTRITGGNMPNSGKKRETGGTW